MTTSYRPDIDGLRALAVLSVLGFHFGMPGVSGGFVGVDVFFVISGYLITALILADIRNGRFSLTAFYERRARRLLPALIAVFAATALMSALILMPAELKRFGDELATAAVFSSNLLFGSETGYFAPDAHARVLLHSWSLAVEGQFYLFFPLLLMMIHRLAPRRIGLVIASLAAFSLLASLALSELQPEKSFFWLHTRFWELAVGALIATGMIRLPAQKGLRELVGIAGLLAILASIATFHGDLPYPGSAALAPTLGTAAIIASGITAPTLVSRLLATRPLVAVGTASYSLYLWHWPLLVLSTAFLMRAPSGTERILLTLTTFALAFLSLRFIEQPFRTRRWLARGKPFLGVLIAASLACGLIGVSFILGRGWPGRLSPDAQALAAVGEETSHFEQRCDVRREPFNPENCLLGQRGKDEMDFIVLGDSHALALADALDELAKKQGLKGVLIAQRGCTPFPDIDKRADPSGACRRRFEAGYAFLDNTRGSPLVIFVARWSHYGSGSNEVRLAHGFSSALKRLEGRRLALMADVPSLPFDAPVTAARALHLARDAPALSDEHSLAQTAEMLLKQAPQVIAIRPTEVLCAEGLCTYHNAGGLLYRDDNHLSRHGAEGIMPLFKAILPNG